MTQRLSEADKQAIPSLPLPWKRRRKGRQRKGRACSSLGILQKHIRLEWPTIRAHTRLSDRQTWNSVAGICCSCRPNFVDLKISRQRVFARRAVADIKLILKCGKTERESYVSVLMNVPVEPHDKQNLTSSFQGPRHYAAQSCFEAQEQPIATETVETTEKPTKSKGERRNTNEYDRKLGNLGRPAMAFPQRHCRMLLVACGPHAGLPEPILDRISPYNSLCPDQNSAPNYPGRRPGQFGTNF
jgi:hypothetical protein